MLFRTASPNMTHENDLAEAIKTAIEDGSGLFEYSFSTPAGAIDCLAEVEISDDCIEFHDLCIYPADGSMPIAPGAAGSAIRQQVKSLLHCAAALGYAEVRIMGKRVASGSSAKPGKVVAINRKVKP